MKEEDFSFYLMFITLFICVLACIAFIGYLFWQADNELLNALSTLPKTKTP